MANFAGSLAATTQKPGRTIILEPWVFADEWNDKPRDPVCVGIRLLSEEDKTKARGEAERLADEVHQNQSTKERRANWVDCFNDCLMRQVCALALCDPNDKSSPTEQLPYAEEQVRGRLTSSGTKFIFHEVDKFEIESSPIQSVATDEEVDELVGLLLDDRSFLTTSHRKFLFHILEQARS